MDRSWVKYLSARAPRYTSYPSALAFSDEVNPAAYSRALGEVDLYEAISIYAHIPFCRQMCWYCGCNMRVENRYERAQAYVDSLCEEARLVSTALGGAGRVSSVHFGGGTPNFLHVDDLARILDCIESEFGLTDSARLAIELDPRLLKQGDAARLAGLGFSRMSLGVQDFDPGVQRAINRIQSFELIEESVAAMRAASVSDISFDLVYGLPRQTEDSFAETVEKAIALAPDRCSVFGYAHLPSALRHQQLIKESELPGDAVRADLAMVVDKLFIAAGYQRIGFDHYAKPDNALVRAMQRGGLRRNFQGFTDDPAVTTIGLGASAIGRIGGVYAQNAKDVADYAAAVAAGDLPTMKGVVRNELDEVAARVIEDLLCRGEADPSTLLAMLPAEKTAQVHKSLAELSSDRVIAVADGRIAVEENAWFLRRVVAAALDPAFEPANRYSAAV